MSEHLYSLIIIDDEPSIREGLASYVNWENLGFNVIGTFSDGRRAIDFMENHRVEAVLTDIKMPNINGLSLCEHIVNNKSHIEVILMSGYKDFEYARKAIHFQVREYLLKPIDIKTLESAFSCLYTDLQKHSNPAAEEQSDTDTCDYRDKAIEKAIEYIDNNYNVDISLADIAFHVHFSPIYLSRFFKEKTGENISKYITKIRIQKAKSLLRDGHYKIYEISKMVGYSDPKYFAKIFKENCGKTPTEYLHSD
jgi:two-component system, response regulator YesN